MAKEVLEFIKLQIPAGGANPAPPYGHLSVAEGGLKFRIGETGTRRNSILL